MVDPDEGGRLAIHTTQPPPNGLPHRLRVSDAVKGFFLAQFVGVVVAAWKGASEFRDSGVSLRDYQPTLGPTVWLLVTTAAVQLIWIFHISLKRYASPTIDYGLTFDRADLLIGFALGGFALGANHLFGRFRTDDGADQAQFSDVFRNVEEQHILIIILVIGLVVPFVEEVFFRGMILRAIERSWGIGAAIAGSSLIFGLGHLSSGDRNGYLRAGWATLLGVSFAIATAVTGRTTAGIIGHALNNTVAMLWATSDW